MKEIYNKLKNKEESSKEAIVKLILDDDIKISGVTLVILLIIAVVSIYGVSWIATCGVVKLITLCFGSSFSWLKATGIWLITCFARVAIKENPVSRKLTLTRKGVKYESEN